MVYIDQVSKVLFVYYHKSSNKHPGAYLIFYPQKGGAYSSGAGIQVGSLYLIFLDIKAIQVKTTR